VIDRAHAVWPLFALMQPLAGLVFALDGILIGAGDTRFLMWSMVAASGLFVLLAALAFAYGWGVIGVWVALDVLIAARLALLGPRFVSRKWALVGWN
jgi:Na+-driven multidrug efflux pump